MKALNLHSYAHSIIFVLCFFICFVAACFNPYPIWRLRGEHTFFYKNITFDRLVCQEVPQHCKDHKGLKDSGVCFQIRWRSEKIGEYRNKQRRVHGQLIDDLLTFSRLGRKELMKTDVLMKDMVASIWEEQIRTEPNRQFDFSLLELPTALVDTSTIRQVWTLFQMP